MGTAHSSRKRSGSYNDSEFFSNPQWRVNSHRKLQEYGHVGALATRIDDSRSTSFPSGSSRNRCSWRCEPYRPRADLARQVQGRDAEIDQREVEVEEDCLKMLALYQPVAIDLRLIVSALKINNDLERIGDLAVNIARKGMAGRPPPRDIPFDFERCGRRASHAPRQHRRAGEHGRRGWPRGLRPRRRKSTA